MKTSKEYLAKLYARGWQSMEKAPKDGTIIVVVYSPWNMHSNEQRYQLAQWIETSPYAREDRFCAPWEPDAGVFADAWMSLEDFSKWWPPHGN